MSRIGKYPVPVPAGVHVALAGRTLTAKGKLGELKLALTDDVEVEIEDGEVAVDAAPATTAARAPCGARTRSLVNNMVTGVSDRLHARPSRSPASATAPRSQGKDLVLQLGYSHEIRYPIPDGITISLRDADRRSRSAASTSSRSARWPPRSARYRGPEPYKGKGITYDDEYDPPQGREEEVMARQARTLRARAAARGCATSSGSKSGGPSAPVGVPLGQAHLRAGHRRRAGRTLAAASSLEKDACATA